MLPMLFLQCSQQELAILALLFRIPWLCLCPQGTLPVPQTHHFPHLPAHQPQLLCSSFNCPECLASCPAQSKHCWGLGWFESNHGQHSVPERVSNFYVILCPTQEGWKPPLHWGSTNLMNVLFMSLPGLLMKLLNKTMLNMAPTLLKTQSRGTDHYTSSPLGNFQSLWHIQLSLDSFSELDFMRPAINSSTNACMHLEIIRDLVIFLWSSAFKFQNKKINSNRKSVIHVYCWWLMFIQWPSQMLYNSLAV